MSMGRYASVSGLVNALFTLLLAKRKKLIIH